MPLADNATLEERVAELERQVSVQFLALAALGEVAFGRKIGIPRAQTKALINALQTYADDPSEENLQAAIDAATAGRA